MAKLSEQEAHILREILKSAQKIATMEKQPGPNSGDGYAYALGACNGIAKAIIGDVEYLLKGAR